MANNYDFLKKYVGHNDLKGTYFLKVEENEICEGELILKHEFPSQLKEFYKEIGYGTLSCGEKYPEMYHEVSNFILPPITVANFSKGILEFEDQDFYMAESSFEDLEPGDFPFFEIMNSSKFLIMKLNSENPNAVWYDSIKISDSLEEFIRRLYYENSTFYDDIITAYYQDQ